MADDRNPVSLPKDSLLVYPPSGLMRLRCPIWAVCVRNIPPYHAGAYVRIMGIGYTRTDPLMYLIGGKFYSHSYFQILTKLNNIL
ncbi:hypothetical protein [Gracilimonas sp. BCB1]|uniref:hypothetical protein n=1 Tax=Gracilimonas sp. BCB1 TaxID=3152362 RepID=UPI0032D93C83